MKKTSNETVSKSDTEVSDFGDHLNGPSRPIIAQYPMSDFSGTKRGFTQQFYNRFEWLEYSILKDAVFCFACRQFPSSGKEDLFTERGLRNWKKASEKLQKHAVSNSHLLSSESVATQISVGHQELVQENRLYLKKILDILLYHARQGLPCRGHDKSKNAENKGNFLELCELFSKYDISFKTKLERYNNLTSGTIQNDLLHIVNQTVIRCIGSEINEAGFYSVLVDEAKSHKCVFVVVMCTSQRLRKGYL